MARVTVVAGLGFGDEGKGATVDWLCRQRETVNPVVVRYNGGPQCSHAVVTPEGQTHLFHQFGSGTLTNCRTFYDRAAIFDPIALVMEAEKLAAIMGCATTNVLALFQAHPDCMITTLYHRTLNQICARRVNNGTCGFGIGITRRMYLQYGPDSCVMLRDCLVGARTNLIRKLRFIRDAMIYEAFESNLNVQTIKDMDPANVATELINHVNRLIGSTTLAWSPPVSDWYIYEGAQGFLLDQDYGFAPNNTWSDLTLQASVDSMSEHNLWLGRHEHEFLGIIRSGHTRHGAGPLPGQTHYNNLDKPTSTFDTNNPTNEYQGGFRFGKFDNVLFRYATENIGSSVAQLTGIVVNHMDQLNNALPVITGYEQLGNKTLTEYLSRSANGDRLDSIVFPSAVASRKATELLISTSSHVSGNISTDDEFLHLVANTARTPVVLRSYGPTHAERSKCNITPG